MEDTTNLALDTYALEHWIITSLTTPLPDCVDILHLGTNSRGILIKTRFVFSKITFQNGICKMEFIFSQRKQKTIIFTTKCYSCSGIILLPYIPIKFCKELSYRCSFPPPEIFCQKPWHFCRNIRSCVENESRYSRTVNKLYFKSIYTARASIHKHGTANVWPW